MLFRLEYIQVSVLQISFIDLTETVITPESKVELSHTQLVTLFNFVKTISPNGSLPCISGSAALQLNQTSDPEAKYIISDLDFISVANPWQPMQIIDALKAATPEGFSLTKTAHVDEDDSHAHAADQSFNSHYLPASHIVTLKVLFDGDSQPIPLELICSDDSAGYKYKDQIALGEGEYLDLGEFNVFDAANPKSLITTPEVTHLSLPALTIYYLVAKAGKANEIIRRSIEDGSIDTLITDMVEITDPRLHAGLNELRRGIEREKNPPKSLEEYLALETTMTLNEIISHWFPITDLRGGILNYYTEFKKFPTSDGEAEVTPTHMLPLTDLEVFKKYKDFSRILAKLDPIDKAVHYANMRKTLTDSTLAPQDRKAKLIAELENLKTLVR